MYNACQNMRPYKKLYRKILLRSLRCYNVTAIVKTRFADVVIVTHHQFFIHFPIVHCGVFRARVKESRFSFKPFSLPLCHKETYWVKIKSTHVSLFTKYFSSKNSFNLKNTKGQTLKVL